MVDAAAEEGGAGDDGDGEKQGDHDDEFHPARALAFAAEEQRDDCQKTGDTGGDHDKCGGVLMRFNRRLIHTGNRRPLVDDVFGLVSGRVCGDRAERGDDGDDQAGRRHAAVANDYSNKQQDKSEQRRIQRRVIDGQMEMNEIHFLAVSAARRSVASFSACALIGGL